MINTVQSRNFSPNISEGYMDLLLQTRWPHRTSQSVKANQLKSNPINWIASSFINTYYKYFHKFPPSVHKNNGAYIFRQMADYTIVVDTLLYLAENTKD